MARLIDADDLMVYLHCRMGQIPCDEYGLYLLADVAEYVAKMPAIEAEPVKRGKWVKDESRDMLRCSVCKNFCVENWYYWLRYCPDCGARMDGE